MQYQIIVLFGHDFLGTNETLLLLPTDELRHKNFTGSELMELVAGKSAKHEAEAIAKF